MNAVIWVRQGKTRLALANISGAMMIQATVPSGLGLLFTSWRFGTPLLISGLATMAAIPYLLILLRARRFTATTVSFAALFYLAFGACLIPVLASHHPAPPSRPESGPRPAILPPALPPS